MLESFLRFLLFLRLKYTYIIVSIPFLFANPVIYLSFRFLKFMVSFLFLKLTAVTCMCIPKYNLLSPYNVAFGMFSGMAFWYWMSNWCTLPWGTSFLLLSAFLAAHSPLCILEALWYFPHPLWHVNS